MPESWAVGGGLYVNFFPVALYSHTSRLFLEKDVVCP